MVGECDQMGSNRWRLNPLERDQLVNLSTHTTKRLKRPDCRVLEILVENSGEVVSKKMLLEQAWSGRIVSESSLTQSIAKIRLALGDNGKDQKYIRTVPNGGYLILKDVVQLINLTSLEAPSDVVALGYDRPESKKNQFRPTVTRILAVLLLLIASAQLVSIVHNVSLKNRLTLNHWVEQKVGNITFTYADNPKTEKLYKFIAQFKKNNTTAPITAVMLSVTPHDIYLSCIYHHEETGESRVKNLTFTAEENIYFLEDSMNEICR
ncbi:transcriptional regulator [Vibrio ostreicida]|uniref:winged helix-turn-helix domain-containing protein n=1 Tax=Vibrio ostreicida TaxID=526588 RepID=UPI00097140CC|nr:winged helix-turn-helix domain-containing protein [Vibrio ostreicida]NPD09466.1 hypothetical protein [Vibrio ostreicida]